MINVTSEVRVYEKNGKETEYLNTPKIIVENHWNRDSFVVLVIDGVEYTVVAGDLDAAIRNATYVHR